MSYEIKKKTYLQRAADSLFQFLFQYQIHVNNDHHTYFRHLNDVK